MSERRFQLEIANQDSTRLTVYTLASNAVQRPD
jgi:hypothetical protein